MIEVTLGEGRIMGNVPSIPFMGDLGSSIEIEDLHPGYPYPEERTLDMLTNALARGRISKVDYLELLPDIDSRGVGESLKRLFNRGYLTNEEVQNTVELFGGWVK